MINQNISLPFHMVRILEKNLKERAFRVLGVFIFETGKNFARFYWKRSVYILAYVVQKYIKKFKNLQTNLFSAC